jgi:hypothetical protein
MYTLSIFMVVKIDKSLYNNKYQYINNACMSKKRKKHHQKIH